MIGGEVVQTEYVDIRRISTGLSVFDRKNHSCGIYRRSVFGPKWASSFFSNLLEKWLIRFVFLLLLVGCDDSSIESNDLVQCTPELQNLEECSEGILNDIRRA